MKRDRDYWSRKMRKLRNRTRKLRVECNWLALDPYCETEASVWEPKKVLAQMIQREVGKALSKLKHSIQQSYYGIARSVAPAPQSVSKVQHNQVIGLQGDYFLSDT